MEHPQKSIRQGNVSPVRLTFLQSVLAIVIALSLNAHTQTFSVLHTFTGGVDGASPYDGVTIAHSGLLYGTTYAGGTYGHGVAFALRNSGSGWTLNPLHEFGQGSDGQLPQAPLTVGPNGALYGTTEVGGTDPNGGTVFELQPPANACPTASCYWRESILHSFQGGNDGAEPAMGALIFDQAGNIYGTTSHGGGGPCNLGGTPGCGTVFQLSPSGNGWTESILHSFDGSDGDLPGYGLIFDTVGPAGSLYGTTNYGGSNDISDGGDGTAFQLSPSGGNQWTETVLFNFDCLSSSGCHPDGTLIRDASGNLYGTTYDGDSPSSVFELSYSSGGWGFSPIYSSGGGCGQGGVAMDSAGNIYGACLVGGAYGFGWVSKMTNSGGSWTTTDIHDFSGHDGEWPYGGVSLDSSGNLYGTTFFGGDLDCNGGLGCGTVWEITP